jgi:hypothetical protein
MSGWQKYMQDAMSGGELAAGIGTGNPILMAQGGMGLANGIAGQGAPSNGQQAGPLGTPAPGLAGVGSLTNANPASAADPSGALGTAQQQAPLVGMPPANAPNSNPQQQQQGQQQAPPTPPQPPTASGGTAGDVGQIYLNYLSQSRLNKMKNPNAYAQPHSTPEGPGITGLQLPQMQTQLPQL